MEKIIDKPLARGRRLQVFCGNDESVWFRVLPETRKLKAEQVYGDDTITCLASKIGAGYDFVSLPPEEARKLPGSLMTKKTRHLIR